MSLPEIPANSNFIIFKYGSSQRSIMTASIFKTPASFFFSFSEKWKTFGFQNRATARSPLPWPTKWQNFYCLAWCAPSRYEYSEADCSDLSVDKDHKFLEEKTDGVDFLQFNSNCKEAQVSIRHSTPLPVCHVLSLSGDLLAVHS